MAARTNNEDRKAPAKRARLDTADTAVRPPASERVELKAQPLCFASAVVSTCIPALVHGQCFAHWPAIHKWFDREGLPSLEGFCATDPGSEPSVDVLLSRGSEFMGVVQTPRQTMKFRDLVKYGRTRALNRRRQHASAAPGGPRSHENTETQTEESEALRCYLCQCTIMNQGLLQEHAGHGDVRTRAGLQSSQDRPQLPHLAQDVLPLPAFIPTESVTEVNFWLSFGNTDSNLHYDESNNLLCVLSGQKSVVLFPPSATVALQPRSVAAPSANHSQTSTAQVRACVVQHVELGTGAASEACRAQATVPSREHTWCAPVSCDLRSPPAGGLARGVECLVRAGQALYIPEGWWHQVRSTGHCTVAVNLWWKGLAAQTLDSGAMEHMRGFYVRSMLCQALQSELSQRLSCPEHTPRVISFSELYSLHKDVRGDAVARALCGLRPQGWKVMMEEALRTNSAAVVEVVQGLTPAGCAAFIKLMEDLEDTISPSAAGSFFSTLFGAFPSRDEAVSALLAGKSAFTKSCLLRVFQTIVDP